MYMSFHSADPVKSAGDLRCLPTILSWQNELTIQDHSCPVKEINTA
jgi:hypothetical protein